MAKRIYKRIYSIAEFLARAPHPEQVVEFLSANISPLDEVSVAYRGAVDPNGEIRCENIQGFHKYQILSKLRIHISDERPISVAARAQKIVWANYSNVMEEFPNFDHVDDYTPWESLVAFPVTLAWVYSFSFSSDLRHFDKIDSYFDVISSMLKVYESALELKKSLGRRTFLEESEIQPLSDRQMIILEYLKTGMTNKEIAELIGYSESLVRHETMIIYKKLRVKGRHQLREKIND